LKIAIDNGALTSGHSVRGIGVMVKEQIEALQKRAGKNKGVRIQAFNFKTSERKLETGGFGVVHYPYFFPYSLTLPPRKVGKKMVVTIQDLIHLVYPKNYPCGTRGKLYFHLQKQRLRNVDAVITISETSKKDIVRFLGIHPDKVHVVYLAPKKIFKKLRDEEIRKVRKKYNLPNKFILYVGDVNHNKNVLGLIKACKLARTPLVIVGKQALELEEHGLNLNNLKGPRDWVRFLFDIPHPELVHYNDLLDEFRNGNAIIRTGFVPDEDLVAIYNLASVYCQPSFYEGFGLPVLEAMACGTPVVISKTNALVEVTGGACLVADPMDYQDMSGKITNLLKNQKDSQEYVQRGLERVKEFSWKNTAKEIIDIYKLVSGF